ncbi:MAG: hypothetical protein AB1726_09815 [Planctomycetota bacterium]
MERPPGVSRTLAAGATAGLRRPPVVLQPVLAKAGRPNVDLARLAEVLRGVAEMRPAVSIQSRTHWERTIAGADARTDGFLAVSIAAYPTEIWNADPAPLVERGLPVLFWPILPHDEPDLWRWSARDFLRALGVKVHLVRHERHGLALLRSLGVRRLLRGSRLVLFGEQNFPWNATAAGHLVTRALGTRLVVRPLEDLRARYAGFGDDEIDRVWTERAHRYTVGAVRPADLRQAVRTYLAIRAVLAAEHALGFGVNCFGDLIVGGGRDVPCLAQTLLREDGYIAACDGDYLALMSMVLATGLLDAPCLMSNLYPIAYAGALTDHFGDPLAPDPARHPPETWRNLARLGHCGFVGVVSPEMDPSGRVPLHDWGGTYEIRRDGRGCGNAGELVPGPVTLLELDFAAETLLIGAAEVLETTHHAGLPHCEKTALLRLRDLEGFVTNISREHPVVVYGEHAEDFAVLAEVLGLRAVVV